MYVFRCFLYNKFDSLYYANNLMLSIVCCYFNIFSNVCLKIYLNGDLGIGKTFFVKGLIKGIGYDNVIQSPTYNIYDVFFYNGIYIYHFDLYRLNKIFDFKFICDEYEFDFKSIFIFEWPQKSTNNFFFPDLEIDIFLFLKKRYLVIRSFSYIAEKILFYFKSIC